MVAVHPSRSVGGRRFLSWIPASRQLQHETLTALNCEGRLVIHRQVHLKILECAQQCGQLLRRSAVNLGVMRYRVRGL